MADTFDRLKTALADRYAIQEELGAGGMATVYLAEDLRHHRKVAVKVLRPELDAVVVENGELRVIAATPAGETWTTISPDGRWVAYGSVESGEPHVYVQPHPPTGKRWPVSVDGGAEEPRWSVSGDELVFRSGRQWLAVSIETAPTFRASRPRVLRGLSRQSRC